MDEKFDSYIKHFYDHFQRFTKKEFDEIMENGFNSYDLFRLEYMIRNRDRIDFQLNKLLKEIGIPIQIRDQMSEYIQPHHIELFMKHKAEYNVKPISNDRDRPRMEKHGMNKMDLAKLFYLTDKTKEI